MDEQQVGLPEGIVVAELVGDRPPLRRLTFNQVPPKAPHRLLLSSLAQERRTAAG
jgi:hypothetical protein